MYNSNQVLNVENILKQKKYKINLEPDETFIRLTDCTSEIITQRIHDGIIDIKLYNPNQPAAEPLTFSVKPDKPMVERWRWEQNGMSGRKADEIMANEKYLMIQLW